ncbi:MAG: hypothetical protein H7Y37_10080 [Anaerolineae bacterium]|nr:hypothetical protein [Gloeobacterales cyanobacterium ES-bin-313]
MVIAWLRSLLIFDGFLAPSGTATVPTSKPIGESWLRQLLVLDGFIEPERGLQNAAQVSVEARVLQAPRISLPTGLRENSKFETTVASVSTERFVPESAPNVDAPEIAPHSEEAITDWQRILGWKE